MERISERIFNIWRLSLVLKYQILIISSSLDLFSFTSWSPIMSNRTETAAWMIRFPLKAYKRYMCILLPFLVWTKVGHLTLLERRHRGAEVMLSRVKLSVDQSHPPTKHAHNTTWQKDRGRKKEQRCHVLSVSTFFKSYQRVSPGSAQHLGLCDKSLKRSPTRTFIQPGSVYISQQRPEAQSRCWINQRLIEGFWDNYIHQIALFAWLWRLPRDESARCAF